MSTLLVLASFLSFSNDPIRFSYFVFNVRHGPMKCRRSGSTSSCRERQWGGARDRMGCMIARRLIMGAAVAAGILGVAPKVAAQGYPERPIKLIVPFPPG